MTQHQFNVSMVLDFLMKNKKRAYTYEEIADELEVKRETVVGIVRRNRDVLERRTLRDRSSGIKKAYVKWK